MREPLQVGRAKDAGFHAFFYQSVQFGRPIGHDFTTMRKTLIIAICILLVSSLSSCTHRLTDFTVISTKNIPIGEGVHTDFQKGTKRVKGVDVAHTVLFLPLGFPNMKEAIDKAIEEIPGAVGLVDGVVKSSGWTCFLYGQNRYIVEGTPLFPTDFNYEEASMGRPEAYNNKTNSQTTAPYTPTVKSPTEVPSSTSETYLFFHEAKDGESLVSIAKQYDVSVGDIIKWNKLNSSTLTKGQKLKIHIKE